MLPRNHDDSRVVSHEKIARRDAYPADGNRLADTLDSDALLPSHRGHMAAGQPQACFPNFFDISAGAINNDRLDPFDFGRKRCESSEGRYFRSADVNHQHLARADSVDHLTDSELFALEAPKWPCLRLCRHRKRSKSAFSTSTGKPANDALYA
jgi:hypothetical protein